MISLFASECCFAHEYDLYITTQVSQVFGYWPPSSSFTDRFDVTLMVLDVGTSLLSFGNPAVPYGWTRTSDFSRYYSFYSHDNWDGIQYQKGYLLRDYTTRLVGKIRSPFPLSVGAGGSTWVSSNVYPLTRTRYSDIADDSYIRATDLFLWDYYYGGNIGIYNSNDYFLSDSDLNNLVLDYLKKS